MALQSSDVFVFEEFLDPGPEATSFVGDVKSYTADTLYLLFVGSEDSTSQGKPSGAAGTGLTWTEVDTITGFNEALTLYRCVPSSNTSTATTVSFSSNQADCAWNIIQVNNADTTGTNGANALIQNETAKTLGSETEWTNTLATPVTTGNLVLAGIWTSRGLTLYTAGSGQTNLTTESSGRHGFMFYNLSELELTEAAYDLAQIVCGIVVEVQASSAPVLITPTVTIESPTELSGTVICDTAGDDLFWYISLSAVAPSEAEIITPTVSVADGTQAISGSGVQTVASFGTSFDTSTRYFVYYLAQDTNGNSNIAQVGTTIETVVTLFTLEFIDKTTIVAAADGFTTDERYEILVPGDTDFQAIGAADDEIGTVFIATGAGSGTGTAYHVIPCICESTNFAVGMTAYIDRTLGTEETATVVSGISIQQTSTPQLNCTFTKAPVNGSETISIVYDAAVGDIKSVTGGIALPSQIFDAVAAMVC